MSTVAPRSPASPLNPALPQALVDSEGYIDDHIRRTRRSLKLVDAAAGILTLAVGLLGFLLVAGLVDHWIIPGGLGAVGRMVMFGLLLVGIAWYGWRQFVPLLRSINPVYAAHTIEQSAPSLKNSLLNALLFRTHRQQMSAKVYHALEQQAAQRLSASHADAQIDHGTLLRLGYALVAITAICALYSVLSPKNLAVSAARVLTPWTDISPPSRVHITNVKPGDASVAIGERVTISAEIAGASDDDTVRVHYSTSDESLVDESIVMTRPTTALHFTADLPRATDGGSAGVQQPMEYWIEAGDARSPKFKLEVFQRPTIVVQRVRYAYPDYTREPPAVVDHVGDIRGIEGTTVTVEALASEPIKSAYVDFDGDGTSDKRMTIDGNHATASFTLELRDDRRTPWHLTYALRFTTPEGRTNDDPVQHRLDVQPDYSPEIRITQPEEPELAVHVGDTVMIAVEARDPDYALGGVRLVGRTKTSNGSGEVDVLLADLLATEHAGLYKHRKPFVPADAHLRPGDVLEYWAEARDNRWPDANLALSEHRKLRIVDADAPADPQQNAQGGGGGEQQEGDGGGGEDDQAGASGGQSGGSGGDSEAGDGEAGASGKGGQGTEGETQENSGTEGEAQGGGNGSSSNEQSGDNAQGGGGNGESTNDSDVSRDAAAERGANSNDQTNDGEGSQNQSASQQPGEGGQSGGDQGTASEPISAAGEQDAEAMSRINKHFEQQQAQEGGGEGAGAASEQHQQGPSNENSGEQSGGGESASDGKNTDGASQDNATASEQTPEGDGETPAAADGANNESDGGSPAGDQAGRPGAPEPGAKQPNEQNGDDSQSGAESETGTDTSKGNQQSNARGDQGGDRSGDGNSGGGQQAPNAGQGQAGSHEPSDTGANQSSDPGAGETGTEGGNEQLADGKTGESSGDQAGAGSETGDAKGENPTGEGGEQESESGGQHSGSGNEQSGNSDVSRDAAAERGANEQGSPSESTNDNQQGDDSGQQPGAEGQQTAAGAQQPGQSNASKGGAENSDQQSPPGEGSAGQPSGTEGEQEGTSDAGAQPGGQSASSRSNPGDPSQQNNAGENPSTGGSATNPPAGGTSGGGVNGDGVMSEPGGDDPNMAYARKQTDLVLQRLDEELEDHKVDPSLLKSLGWTEAELRSFVDRWKSLKAAAEAPGDGAAEAQQELDQALKAIGLRPRSSLTIRGAATSDELRDLNEAARKAPVAEYADRVRAYLRAAAEEE
jgi:collagen type III alpha